MNDDPLDLVRELAPPVADQTALVAQVRKDFMASINDSNNGNSDKTEPVQPGPAPIEPGGSGTPYRDIGALGGTVTPITKNQRFGRIAVAVITAAAVVAIGAVIINNQSNDDTNELAATPTSAMQSTVATTVVPDASATTPPTVAPTTPPTVVPTVAATTPPTVAPTQAPTTQAPVPPTAEERKQFLTTFLRAWESQDWTTVAAMAPSNSEQVTNEAMTYWGDGFYVSMLQDDNEEQLDTCAAATSCELLTGDSSDAFGLIFNLTYELDASGQLVVTELLFGGDAG